LFHFTYAADWYFPIQNYENRSQDKTFNQYIDKGFYVGRESLFPTQYTGYHMADDLEINPGEENQNVPVYAVTDAKVSFVGPVTGYGGVILLNIANDSHTALYGHVKVKNLSFKAGDSVKAGQLLAYLGNGFSSETGGERKHLHFGIYNGKDPYFHGYESNETTVQSKWIDPWAYLKEKGAMEVSSQSSTDSGQTKDNQNPVISNKNMNINQNILQLDATSQTDQNILAQNSSNSLISTLLEYLKNLFSKIKLSI